MALIRNIHYRCVRRPLKTTFATALGSKDVIGSIIVRVVLENGACGEGEVPTSFAFREESLPEIVRVIREVVPACRGLSVESYPEAIRKFRSVYPRFTMTISGLEVALFRAWLKSENLTEVAFWSHDAGSEAAAFPLTCRTDITVPFTNDSARLITWLKRVVQLKFTEFKIKLSGNLGEDLDYIKQAIGFLRDHCEDFKIRLDGNQGYQRDSFLHFMEECARRSYPLELVEQPLPKNDYAGLRALRRELEIPIILDESVRNQEDLARAVELEACDGVNIKLAKSGISETRLIIKAAGEHGLKLMVGCMTETMTGLSAAIRMATGSGVFDYFDLDSVFFLFSSGKRIEEFQDIERIGPEYRISN